MAAGGVPGVADGMPANLFRGARRGGGMHVRLVRIDLKALVQLAVVGLVLYQVRPLCCATPHLQSPILEAWHGWTGCTGLLQSPRLS